MTTPATDTSLFDRIAQLLPVELRESFYRRMSHLQQIGPNDDILQIAEAMGFLALVTHEVPAEVTAERFKLEALFTETVAAFKVAHDSTLAYHRDLERRLENLPANIALALDVENVAALLSESIRQRFYDTGLPAISESFAAHAQDLRNSGDEFTKAVEMFSDPDHGAVSQLHRALSSMQADLRNATDHVRIITHALANDLRRTIVVFLLAGLMLGFCLGILCAKQHG